jgi:hypothetical protein
MDMLARCYNPNHTSYPDYGERGITGCDRWRYSLENYNTDIAAILGPKPSPDHTIDRIDYNGNYEPSNIRWATKKEQQRNTRRNIRLTHNGQTKCIAEWAEVLNMSIRTLYSRYRLGWFVENILNKPIRGR